MRKVKRSKDSQVMLQQKAKGLSKRAIWAIALAAIMVLSGVGYYFGSNSGTTFRYNGFKFTQDQGDGQEGRVILHADKQDVTFFNTPETALLVNADPEALAQLKSTIQFYFTFDPNEVQLQAIDTIRFDMNRYLTTDFSIAVGNAILTNETNNTAYLSYNTITCANATKYIPVVVLQMGNVTAISRNATSSSCIIATAERSGDMLLLRDRILYSFYGVLP